MPLMVQEEGPERREGRSGMASSEGAFIWIGGGGGGGGGGMRVCAASATGNMRSKEVAASLQSLARTRIR
jgi:hypothetical protein